MGIEENKKVALEYFHKFNSNDAKQMATILSDDLDWHFMGFSPLSKTVDKVTLLSAASSAFAAEKKTPITMTVKEMIAEGDRVAVEAESYMEPKEGPPVRNQYHYAFTIKDGRVKTGRVYFCTYSAAGGIAPPQNSGKS